MLKLADFGLAIDLNEEKAVTRAGTLVRVRAHGHARARVCGCGCMRACAAAAALEGRAPLSVL